MYLFNKWNQIKTLFQNVIKVLSWFSGDNKSASRSVRESCHSEGILFVWPRWPLTNLANHEWFIQRVWNLHQLFMDMTSLSCKFLKTYANLWQEGLNGRVFFPPPLALVPALKMPMPLSSLSTQFSFALSDFSSHSFIVWAPSSQPLDDGTHLPHLLLDSWPSSISTLSWNEWWFWIFVIVALSLPARMNVTKPPILHPCNSLLLLFDAVG